MPLPFNKYPEFIKTHPMGITIKDAIRMYKWMLEKGKLKENGPAHQRLKQLEMKYASGLRHFPRQTTYTGE